MDASTGFLIYVALYRLTVLAVGALSIWLGFRLFSNAKSKTADSSGSASAEGGGMKLAFTFTNLLPGTYFALFGTVIVSIMLWKGEPQLMQKEMVASSPGGTLLRSKENLTRLDCRSDLGNIDAEWGKLNANVTLAESAGPLRKIACFYWKENRIGEAVAMARLAALYGSEDNRAAYLTLLAELLLANGNEEEAVETEQAAESLRRQGK